MLYIYLLISFVIVLFIYNTLNLVEGMTNKDENLEYIKTIESKINVIKGEINKVDRKVTKIKTQVDEDRKKIEEANANNTAVADDFGNETDKLGDIPSAD